MHNSPLKLEIAVRTTAIMLINLAVAILSNGHKVFFLFLAAGLIREEMLVGKSTLVTQIKAVNGCKGSSLGHSGRITVDNWCTESALR